MVCAALKPDTSFQSVLYLIQIQSRWGSLQPPPTTITLGAMTGIERGKRKRKRVAMKDQVLSWDRKGLRNGKIKDGG